ncbi:DUF6804 family protein [Bacteroides gallinaceum]|uniref:DUF6804 family protein n=1 Tax=Bacteroides gallinaceum TaxID=1462571 RepID=UPI00339D9A23
MKCLKQILIIALVLCLAPMPYGYYILVRYFAMVVFGLMTYQYYQEKKENLMITFGALAVLFQPFLKIPLGRIVWNIVDVAIAIVLLVILLKEHESKK